MCVTYVNFYQEFLLRDEIMIPNHYRPLGGKTKGTRSTPYYSSK
jgi:hypothetical protein